MAKGAVNQANINAQELQSIKVYIPDKELQKQFIEMKNQVDKSKFDTMTFAPIYAIINLYLHIHFYQEGDEQA